ncbi:TPA: hypothetical protein DCE37_13815 [Candidatus Latescibacteria bacterium]|nr:hypothetical protein [Candidatus Latescibacterota bacterium]|tara:strand:+ start:174 stop:416 length:243 start_codon:yes stop_codon:yes gene_type:complete
MSVPDPATYRALVVRIGEVLSEGLLRAQRAVEFERLAMYKEVGWLIQEYLPSDKVRPDYGEKLFVRLSDDQELAFVYLGM